MGHRVQRETRDSLVSQELLDKRGCWDPVGSLVSQETKEIRDVLAHQDFLELRVERGNLD